MSLLIKFGGMTLFLMLVPPNYEEWGDDGLTYP
jgi:hypothetical protein